MSLTSYQLLYPAVDFRYFIRYEKSVKTGSETPSAAWDVKNLRRKDTALRGKTTAVKKKNYCP